MSESGRLRQGAEGHLGGDPRRVPRCCPGGTDAGLSGRTTGESRRPRSCRARARHATAHGATARDRGRQSSEQWHFAKRARARELRPCRRIGPGRSGRCDVPVRMGDGRRITGRRRAEVGRYRVILSGPAAGAVSALCQAGRRRQCLRTALMSPTIPCPTDRRPVSGCRGLSPSRRHRARPPARCRRCRACPSWSMRSGSSAPDRIVATCVAASLSLTRFGRMFTDFSLAVGIAPHRTARGHERRAVGGRCRADGGEIR